MLGASGSGKSSVVFAGLVPRLQQAGHWQFTYFRPGSDPSRDPFQALAQALVPLYAPDQDATEQMVQARKLASHLRSGELLLMDVISRIQHNYRNQRVLLIADQFEELYTLCPDEATRRSFLDCLLGSLSPAVTGKTAPLVLMATMRADFLGNALSYRPLADILHNGDVKLGAMNREELSQVIEQPAAKLGVTFEAGLVKRILDAVVDEPGNLPLLEFALTELWGRRSGKQLTHAAYEAIGEVEGALARYADEQYTRLSQSKREQVRRIFIQLVRPGEGTEDTRRLATKAELGEEQWKLVEQLADSRLVVTSRDGVKQETVEVVHEALIRNWSHLREWMAKDRLFRAWQERIRAAMHQWEETKRDEGVLLRGLPLAEAEEKLLQRREELSPSEQNFIQHSIELRERLHQEEKRRRRRGIAGSVVAVLAIMGTLGGAAWYQSKQAALNSDKAKYYSFGFVEAQQGNKKAAMYNYEQALHLDSNDPHTHFGLGVIRSELGDNQGAIANYNQALRLDPNYARVYNNRGLARSELGDKKGAITDYDQALRLNPKDADAYYNRGLVRSALGDKKGAITDYDQALRLNPSYVKAYNNRGSVRSELGDNKGAIADYDQALRLDPNYADAYNNRGNARWELGDNKGAIADYEQALRLDPKDAYTYYNRGLARSTLGDKKGAMADYEQALRLDPKYAKAYINRGLARSELGDKKGAMADYEQALRLDPKNALVYTGRGITRSELGDKKGALADFEQALRLDPKNADVYTGRGITRSELGDKKGALADFDQALRLGPKLASAYNNRGLARWDLGDKKGAMADYDQALRLDPKDADASNNRKRLLQELQTGNGKGQGSGQLKH